MLVSISHSASRSSRYPRSFHHPEMWVSEALRGPCTLKCHPQSFLSPPPAGANTAVQPGPSPTWAPIPILPLWEPLTFYTLFLPLANFSSLHMGVDQKDALKSFRTHIYEATTGHSGQDQVPEGQPDEQITPIGQCDMSLKDLRRSSFQMMLTC